MKPWVVLVLSVALIARVGGFWLPEKGAKGGRFAWSGLQALKDGTTAAVKSYLLSPNEKKALEALGKQDPPPDVLSSATTTPDIPEVATAGSLPEQPPVELPEAPQVPDDIHDGLSQGVSDVKTSIDSFLDGKAASFDIKLQDLKIPELKFPDAKLSELKFSDAKLPDFKLPDHLPEFKLPDNLPDFNIPMAPMADGVRPSLRLPDMPHAEYPLPGLKVKESVVESLGQSVTSSFPPAQSLTSTTAPLPPLDPTVKAAVDASQAAYEKFSSSAAHEIPGSAPLLVDYLDGFKSSYGGLKAGVDAAAIKAGFENSIDNLKHMDFGGLDASIEKLKAVDPKAFALPTWDTLPSNEKLLLLQANIENMIGQLSSIKVDEAVSAKFQSLAAVVEKEGWTLKEVMDTLEVQEYGGWYVGVLAVLAGVTQRAEGNAVAKELETKLAAANDKIAQEALLADEKIRALTTEKQSMEKHVKELTELTSQVSEELKALKVEKAERDAEMAAMKKDVESMRGELQDRKAAEQNLKKMLRETETRLQTETAELRAELEKRIATELDLRQELQDSEVRWKGENDKLTAELQRQTAVEMELRQELFETQARLEVATLANQASSEAGQRAAPQLDAAAKAIELMKVEREAMKAVVAQLTEEGDNLRSQLQASISQGAAVPAPVQQQITVETPEGEAMMNVVAREAVNGLHGGEEHGVEKKKAPPKERKKSKDPDDWSELSPSALKRKTVKELKAYLEDRGLDVVNAAGKPMKKAELVEAVRSVLTY